MMAIAISFGSLLVAIATLVFAAVTWRKNTVLQAELRGRDVAERARTRLHELTVQAATATSPTVLESIEKTEFPNLHRNLPFDLDAAGLLSAIDARRKTLQDQKFVADIKRIAAAAHDAAASMPHFPERDARQDGASRQAGINQNAVAQDFYAKLQQGLYGISREGRS